MKLDRLFNRIAGFMFALTTMFSFTSCDLFFDLIENPVPPEVVDAIVEKTGASAAEVTSLLSEAMLTPEVQKAINNNESFTINVAVPGGSSAAGETITVPVSGGEGKNGGDVTITFTNAVTGTSDTNPLNFTAANASSASEGAAGSGNSDNKLTINMPSGSSGLVITIDLPDTSVTLTTNGTTVYKQVTARTALNTLIVDKGVTIEDFVAGGGRLLIKEGGKVNRLVFAPRQYLQPPHYDHTNLFLDYNGAFGLAIMKVEGDYDNPENWTTFAVQEDGEWYRFKNLKILPPIDCPYMNIKGGPGPHGEIPILNSLTIADGGAALFSTHGPMFDENGDYIGEGEMSYRQLKTVITGEGDDARLYYESGTSFNGFPSITNVKVVPQPEEWVQWDMAINGFSKISEDCLFAADWYSINDYSVNNKVTLKNCVFEGFRNSNARSMSIETPENPQDFSEITITFDGCTFAEGFKINTILTDGTPALDEHGEPIHGYYYHDYTNDKMIFTTSEEEFNAYRTAHFVENTGWEDGYWGWGPDIKRDPIDFTNVNLDFTIKFINGCKLNDNTISAIGDIPNEWVNSWVGGWNKAAKDQVHLSIIIGTNTYKLQWIEDTQTPVNSHWGFVLQQ